MDTWHKFKNKEIKTKDKQKHISEAICYGNFLLHDILWRIVNDNLNQKMIDKFFEQANIVLQLTKDRQGFTYQQLQEVYDYIDQLARDSSIQEIPNRELALMLGNATEIEDAHYTFVELIGFMRVLASKI